MKVGITQANLNKGLGVVGRIVGSRATLPVLANVLVATDANRLRLSSTNLEIGINHWLGAKVEKEGSLTVPARLFGEYVNNLPEGTLKLSSEKETLQIKADTTESHLNGIVAAEFPSIPTIKKKPQLVLSVSELKASLNSVVTAASNDDTRPILNGIYFYTEGKKLTMVATDSYRLAETSLDLEKAQNEQLNLIVPVRTIQELLRMLSDDTEVIEIAAEDNQILFRFGDTELISRLIEGEFPKYRELIPKEVQCSIVIPTRDLLNAAKATALFARESGGSISLVADTSKQTLTIKTTAAQVGDSSSKLNAKINGEDTEIALNSRYLLDGLSAITSEEVTFELTGKVNPSLLRPITKDNNYLHLIMPLRG